MFSMLGQYLAMLRDNFSGAVTISSDQVEFLDIAQWAVSGGQVGGSLLCIKSCQNVLILYTLSL